MPAARLGPGHGRRRVRARRARRPAGGRTCCTTGTTVRVAHVEATGAGDTPEIGSTLALRAEVELPGLTPERRRGAGRLRPGGRRRRAARGDDGADGARADRRLAALVHRHACRWSGPAHSATRCACSRTRSTWPTRPSWGWSPVRDVRRSRHFSHAGPSAPRVTLRDGPAWRCSRGQPDRAWITRLEAMPDRCEVLPGDSVVARRGGGLLWVDAPGSPALVAALHACLGVSGPGADRVLSAVAGQVSSLAHGTGVLRARPRRHLGRCRHRRRPVVGQGPAGRRRRARVRLVGRGLHARLRLPARARRCTSAPARRRRRCRPGVAYDLVEGTVPGSGAMLQLARAAPSACRRPCRRRPPAPRRSARRPTPASARTPGSAGAPARRPSPASRPPSGGPSSRRRRCCASTTAWS